MSEVEPKNNEEPKKESAKFLPRVKLDSLIETSVLKKYTAIRRKHNMNASVKGIQLSPEEKSERAKKNWAKLRMHIN